MRTGRPGCRHWGRHDPLAAGLAVWKETTASWPSIGWPTPLRSNCCRLFPARHPVTALELSAAMPLCSCKPDACPAALELSAAMPLCSCKLDACPAVLELSAAMPLSFYVSPIDLENGLPDPQVWEILVADRAVLPILINMLYADRPPLTPRYWSSGGSAACPRLLVYPRLQHPWA